MGASGPVVLPHSANVVAQATPQQKQGGTGTYYSSQRAELQSQGGPRTGSKMIFAGNQNPTS